MIQLLTGDCRTVLPTLSANSVHCVVTSPPYYGLRDYGTAQWEGGDAACDHGEAYRKRRNEHRAGDCGDGGIRRSERDPQTGVCSCGARRIDAQIGLEATSDAFIAEMVAVFRQIRRVLRDDGTVFLNLGDSYAGYHGNKNSVIPTSATNGWTNGTNENLRASIAALPNIKPKDLLLMPARVALALQAPQHYGPIAKETERAWLAAMMDGEGTIGIARNVSARSNGRGEHCQPGYTPYVSMGNQDRELVDRCAEITGHGKSALKDRPAIDSRQIVSRRDYFGWRVDARKAIEIIRDIYPFLVAKRKQAVLAYNLSLSNDAGRSLRGNGRLPQAEQEKREYLKLLINACNQRKPVDMPSWLIEPPSNFEQGWWVRSDIIWCKPNPMPESCRDRPTSAHEHVFLLSKRSRYFWDADAVREEVTGNAHPQGRGFGIKADVLGSGNRANYSAKAAMHNATAADLPTSRNLRNVWEIATHPYSAAHFATFPPTLAERCIRAGTSERGCCAACGAPWVRVTERGAAVPLTPSDAGRKATWTIGDGARDPASRVDTPLPRHYRPVLSEGWCPGCQCNAEVVPATVLDPFSGAGTTALVADRLGRHAIGIDLSHQYVEMARERLTADCPLFAELSPPPATYDAEDQVMADLFAWAAK